MDLATNFAMGENALGEGIALEGVTKRFGQTAAVDGVSFAMAQGEFFVVLGPSGCGKSTLLRLVAGLEVPDEGTVRLGTDVVADAQTFVPPERRSVAVVFQSYALWPHMSVAKNVSFPVEAAGLNRSEAKGVVQEALRAVALEPFATRRPAALSGGQQQRVALARCLASRANTVLMDEPLANLDPHLRSTMEHELKRFHDASGATTLYITHDQREAMALATKIAVMQEGRFLQVDAPSAIYERPASEAVARFIGRGAVLPATVEAVEGTTCKAHVGGQAIEAACQPGTGPGAAQLFVRPRYVHLGDGPLAARAVSSTYRGGTFEVMLEADGIGTLAAETHERPPVGRVGVTLSGGWILPS
ncbi:MAG: ABC transporter ATP-binding protein [Pseudomonadota bacterium]